MIDEAEAFLIQRRRRRALPRVVDPDGARNHVQHIAADVVRVELRTHRHGLAEAELAMTLDAAHEKYAIERNSMLARGCASGRLVSRNAVCGTRQGRTRRLS